MPPPPEVCQDYLARVERIRAESQRMRENIRSLAQEYKQVDNDVTSAAKQLQGLRLDIGKLQQKKDANEYLGKMVDEIVDQDLKLQMKVFILRKKRDDELKQERNKREK